MADDETPLTDSSLETMPSSEETPATGTDTLNPEAPAATEPITPPSVVQPIEIIPPETPVMSSSTPAENPPLPADEPPKKRKVGVIAGVIGLIVLALGLIGLVFLGINSAQHKYTSLQSVTIGATTGERTTFTYPASMVAVSNNGDTAIFADYATVSGSTKTIYSEIDVDSNSVGALTPTAIQAFEAEMKSKTGGYQQIIDGFASQTANQTNDLNFGSFTDFSNKSIKNGLQADFSYKSKINGQTGKGRLIFAFGKERLYGMVLLGEKSVWDRNTGVWNKIAANWVIDQE